MIPRADPVARGGDLDILVLTSSPGFEISHLVGTCFFARCEEKIDVVVLDPGNLTAEQAGFLARLTRIHLK